MKRCILFLCSLLFCASSLFAQNKLAVGIVSFQGPPYLGNPVFIEPYMSPVSQPSVTVEDLVTDAFTRTKLFTVVDRAKMGQIRSEKELQKSEDFIDGSVIEQSKSLGAQYIVVGDISKAWFQQSRSRSPRYMSKAEVAFNIKVIDVSNGMIIASNSFSSKGRGRTAYQDALDDIKPELVQFIKHNFKIAVPVVSVEKKDAQGQALKILVAGGSSIGFKEEKLLKIFESSEVLVDGKKMTHKIPLGYAKIVLVNDENFSEAEVTDGGDKIARKLQKGVKIQCEIITE